jgi:hypothetical protein
MHKTNNLEDGYMGSGKLIKQAIRKYGAENFIKEILHIFDNEIDMKNKEKELVVINEISYNLCDGGYGGFGYINRTRNHHEHNLKVAKKRSYKEPKLVEWYNSDKNKQIIKQSHLDGKYVNSYFHNRKDYKEIQEKSRSEKAISKRKETFAKINHSQGDKNSQYGTCWLTNGQENKKVKKEDVDLWLEKGYYKGRILK